MKRGGWVARLEDLTKGALVSGVLSDRPVRVVDVDWHGSNASPLRSETRIFSVATGHHAFRVDGLPRS